MANTTALPRGRGTLLRLKSQTDYLTPAAGASAVELNAYTRAFNGKRPLEDDDVNGVTGYANPTDDRPAAPGLEDADGSLTVPLDLNQLGYWLAMALGAPGTADAGGGAPAGTKVHTFVSGGLGIPIATLEAFNAAGQLEKMIGGLLQDISLPIGAEKGYAQVPITLMGRQVSDPYAVSVFTGPTVAPLVARVPNSSGVLSIGGTQVGRITKGTLKLLNRIEQDRYAGDNLQSDAFLATRGVDLSITARYVTDALRAFGAVGADGVLPDPFAVALTWRLTDNLKLVVNLPAMRFEKVSVAVQNGGLMTQDLRGRAEVGSGAAMITAVLTNALTGYAF